jgi:hypothetical protein
MDIHEYRRMEERRVAERPNLSGGYPLGTFRESFVPTSAGSTSVLTYLPRTCDAERLPVYINRHGGAFVLGFPEVDDPYCRRIADEVGCIVVNVDCVLAPEHPFPSAVMECYDVARFLASTPEVMLIDPTKIAIGGQSAGGNLAAAVCLLARERGSHGSRRRSWTTRCSISRPHRAQSRRGRHRRMISPSSGRSATHGICARSTTPGIRLLRPFLLRIFLVFPPP